MISWFSIDISCFSSSFHRVVGCNRSLSSDLGTLWTGYNILRSSDPWLSKGTICERLIGLGGFGGFSGFELKKPFELIRTERCLSYGWGMTSWISLQDLAFIGPILTEWSTFIRSSWDPIGEIRVWELVFCGACGSPGIDLDILKSNWISLYNRFS